MLRFTLKFLIVVLVVAAPLSVVPVSLRAGEINAGGGASDDFQLDPALTLGNPDFHLGAVIERDRMYMAARPGWQSKHIPFTFDQFGLPYSGGVYLFDTEQDAKNFSQWLSEDFALDGVLILDRPYFIGVQAYTYKVIGAHEFGDFDYKRDSAVFRTERWETPSGPLVEPFLKALWPVIRHEARQRGYVAVWLLYNKELDLVNIVYFNDRVGPASPTEPDFASLNALASDPIMGRAFERLGWPKLFDRTSWVLTVWFPFEAADSGEAALWPNSPPFPEPYVGDGLCVPSRGENSSNSPDDCLPTCGDGITQAGETTANCPSDVEL